MTLNTFWKRRASVTRVKAKTVLHWLIYGWQEVGDRLFNNNVCIEGAPACTTISVDKRVILNVWETDNQSSLRSRGMTLENAVFCKTCMAHREYHRQCLSSDAFNRGCMKKSI